MTPQQKLCLDTVKRLTRDGVAPSYNEIGADLGLSRTTVHALIHGLKAAGRIRLGGGWRSVTVVEPLECEIGRLIALYGAEAVRAGIAVAGDA